MGEPNVAVLEESVTDAQLRDWMTFFAMEPWGFEADWYRTGTIAAMVGNAAPGRRSGSKPFSPSDFVPRMKPTKLDRPMGSDEIRTAFRAVFGNAVRPKARKEKAPSR